MKKTKTAGKKILSLLLTAAMLFPLQGISVWAEPAGNGTAAAKTAGRITDKAADAQETAEPAGETGGMPQNPVHHCTKKGDGTDTTTWSYVYFGSYPQSEVKGDSLTAAITGASYDTNGDAWVNGTKYRRISKSDTNNSVYFGDSTYRYFKWERIKWRVLNVNGSTMFVVTDKGLDCKNYNEEYTSITWENCTLRDWLNNEFYGTAFSSGEQRAIVTQTVVSEDNLYYNIEGGNDTTDKVYLLSLSEAMNPNYGFCEDYSIYSVSRRVKASDYAHVRGVYINTSDDYAGNGGWWLRSPGNNSNYAADVYDYGCVNKYGYRVSGNTDACVPALHINLSSGLWSMADDGTSGGGGSETPGDNDTLSIASMEIPATSSGKPESTIRFSGRIYLKEGQSAVKEEWDTLISDIKWTSSKPDVADDISCERIGLSIAGSRTSTEAIGVSFLAKKEGEALITGILPDGQTVTSKVTVKGDGVQEPSFDKEIYHASYLYDFYQETDEGMNYMFGSKSPSQILCTDDLVSAAKAWDDMKSALSLVNDPSGILDEPVEKKDLYVGILFTLFEEATENTQIKGKELIKDADTLLDTIKTNMETLHGIKIGEDNNIFSLTKEQKGKLREVSKAFYKENGIDVMADAFSAISGVIDEFECLQEFCEYQASCMAIMEMSESYKAVLQDMYEECPTGSRDLKAALDECISVMDLSEKQLAEKMARRRLTVRGQEAAKYGVGELWKHAKEALCTSNPYAALIWTSYKTSVFFCDAVFHASDIEERTVKMAALLNVRSLVEKAYQKEKSSFAALRSKGNAARYLASIDTFFRYLDEDCIAADEFVETVSGSLASKIQSLFQKNSAAEVRKNIESIQSDYNLEYKSTKRGWIYNLENDYPAEYLRYRYLLNESWDFIKKRYNIDCPVDVYVYDASGEIAASVVNGVPYCREDAPFTAASNGDSKEIWFYGDEGEYTLRYVGTDSGRMDISIEEYDEDGTAIRRVKHVDVPLTDGAAYVSKENLESSANTYELESEQTAENRFPAVDTADKKIPKYTLRIENGYLADGLNIGTVGAFGMGEKVTVYANVPDGYEFTGWVGLPEGSVSVDKDTHAVTFAMPPQDVQLKAGRKAVSGDVHNPGTGNGGDSQNGGAEKPGKTSLAKAQITLETASFIYDGNEKKPPVAVRLGTKQLSLNKDYILSYDNNKAVGTAAVTVTGTGNYTGSLKKTFIIVPKGTSVSGRPRAKSKGFTVKWKKQKSAAGYQVQYSTDKKFAGKTRIKTVKKKSASRFSVGGLKSNKTYYVRVRTYQTVKGRQYQSPWSKAKKVRTKR